MVTNPTEESVIGIDLGSEIADGDFAEWPRQQTYASKVPLWAPIAVVFALAAVASFYLPIFADRPERPPARSGLMADLRPSAAPETTMHPKPTLGMRALRQADTVLISWDPKAVGANSAIEGFLDVRDGNEEKHLRLDTNQISTGLMSYNARAVDLLLTLEFRNAQGPVMSQSLALLGDIDSLLPKTAAPLVDHIATAPIGPAGNTGRRVVSSDQTGSKEPNPKRIQQFSPATRQIVSAPRDEVAKQDAAKDPPARLQAAAPAVERAPAYDAPVLNASIPSSTMADEAIDRLTPKPVLVQPPSPALQPKTDTVLPAAVPTQGKPIALDPNAGNYTPPRPLKWGPPSAKKANISIGEPVDVALKIRIDEFGRVTKVRTLNDGQKTSKELMKLADDSVRRWVFEPARYKGKAIASEDTIVLRIEK